MPRVDFTVLFLGLAMKKISVFSAILMVLFGYSPVLLAQSITCKSAACIPVMLQSISPINETQLNSAADMLSNKEAFNKGNRKEARKLNEDALRELNAGNFSSASNLLKQAVEIDPSDVEINSNYGFALLRSGNYGAAKSQLHKTLELNPRRTSTWLPLAETYALSGQTQQANQAGLIAFYYSTDKTKAQTYYLKQSQEQSNPQLRTMYVNLTREVSNTSNAATPSTPQSHTPKPEPSIPKTSMVTQGTKSAEPEPSSGQKGAMSSSRYERGMNALVAQFGPSGWARCTSAWATVLAISVRSPLHPDVQKGVDNTGNLLGEMRKVMLANGIQQSLLDNLVKSQPRINSGDEALGVVVGCHTKMASILSKVN